MIRQPSRVADLYAWHRAALAGDAPPIHDGDPQCGWFKTRAVKGGPWVPARIWITRDLDPETFELAGDETFACEIDGARRSAEASWTYLAHHPISKADHDALITTIAATPAMQASRTKIDLTKEPMRP